MALVILDRLMVELYVRLSMTNIETMTLLREQGYFEYGEVITGYQLRSAFEIEEIEYPAMKHEIDAQSLKELNAVDYIRNRLLNEGKYLKGDRDSYRILLPSENAAQVLSYMNSADNKLKRGLKLNKNTQVQYKINSNDEVRAMMKLSNKKE